MSWCCLTSGDERFAIKTLGYGRNDVAHEALSKLRGASDFYVPHHHFSFLISHPNRVFVRNQEASRPVG